MKLLNINNKVCVSFDLIMDQKHESSERYVYNLNYVIVFI